MTARVAPEILAKTSKTSAVLVVVKNCWINSIAIPKKNENTKAHAKGLRLLGLFNFFFKYKNQSVVNTK